MQFFDFSIVRPPSTDMIEKLNKLKLEIKARNPSYLGVLVPEDKIQEETKWTKDRKAIYRSIDDPWEV